MPPDTLAAIQLLAQFAAALPGEIHPSGRMAIRELIRDAQSALDIGDNAEAARLLRYINEKAALELGWHAEDLGLDADGVADVARRASLGDVIGAAERLRELDGQHAA
jgi:hypothetical protein